MHYKDLGRAASVDADFSDKIVSADETGCPAKPIAIDYDAPYEKALKTKDPKDIAKFLKSWRTRTGISSTKIERYIKIKSQELRTLRNLDIVSVDLESSVHVGGRPRVLRDVVIDLFNTFLDVSEQLGRRDYTASSKTLHVLLPKLFVMWDDCIRCAYRCKVRRPKEAGTKYFTFLKRVQREAKEAVESYCKEHNCTVNEAVQEIERSLYEGGFYSFARLLDQYNFQKYTVGDDRLWTK